MRKFFAIWIFKPVMVVLWLIHLGAAYAPRLALFHGV